ncbi:hypothetical protein [Megalodesulfovibrio paquesii]
MGAEYSGEAHFCVHSVTARRQRACNECGRSIAVGEAYQLMTSRDAVSGPWVWRVCADCLSLDRAFDGVVTGNAGQMRQEIATALQALLATLTPPARAWVLQQVCASGTAPMSAQAIPAPESQLPKLPQLSQLPQFGGSGGTVFPQSFSPSLPSSPLPPRRRPQQGFKRKIARLEAEKAGLQVALAEAERRCAVLESNKTAEVE